jgi:hypothetical protein
MAWTARHSMKGAAGSGGAAVPLPPVVGLVAAPKAARMQSFPWFGTASSATISNTGLYAIPFAVARTPVAALAGIGVWVNTAVAGSTARAALYAMDDGLEPAALVTDLGSIDGSTVGLKLFPTVPALTAGWWAVAVTSGATTANLRTVGGTSGSLTAAMSLPAGTAHGGTVFLRAPVSPGDPWPTTFGVTGVVAGGPRIELVF